MSHIFKYLKFVLDHWYNGFGYVCTGMISAVIKTSPVTLGHFRNWVNPPLPVTSVTSVT